MGGVVPYLIRAYCDWIEDSNLTPHILVDFEKTGVVAPEGFAKEGKINLITESEVCEISGEGVLEKLLIKDANDKKMSLEKYVGRIKIIVLNEPGSLGEIASAIGNNKGNIINLKLTSRKKTFFEMLVDIKVKNLNHFTNIIASIRSLEAVSSANRIKGE